jgi:hypothetical protein
MLRCCMLNSSGGMQCSRNIATERNPTLRKERSGSGEHSHRLRNPKLQERAHLLLHVRLSTRM